ncbi:MAG TPA: SurA N-terminal domain-containing protein [Gammaproteobacteria bacterium]|nr:SurA N-terminal domain-containing protein [Gammaproteobacteria bacterium]
MLQTIRDHTQGWLAGTIISVLILMFALWGISAYFTGGSATTIVATVNGVAISKEHFRLSYEQARRQLQNQLGSSSPLTTKQELDLKAQVVQDLIATEALKQASLASNFYISSLQVDNYLQSIPQFQDKGHFSLAKFQEMMAASSYTASELLDLIKTTLLIAQPKLGLVLSSLAFPSETKNTIALVNQERNFNYLKLAATALGNQQLPPITPEQISSYYQAHENEFKTPAQVSVDYLELSLKELSAASSPSQEAIKNYYNENLSNYTQAGQWKLSFVLIPVTDQATQQERAAAETKAKDVLQKIQQGDSFEKFASQYSNPSLQSELAGWQSLQQLPSVLQKPVLALTKANPLSAPIEVPEGYLLLKMTAQQEPQVQTFDQVKAKIADMLAHQQGEEKLAALREQLADLSYEHPDSLQFAAKTLALPIKSSSLFTLDKGGQDISASKKVREAAFSNEVLVSQNNSDVIQVNPETMIVLRIKSQVPQAFIPLASVSAQIQTRLQTDQAKALTAKLANEILQKLQGGAQEAQLAQQYQLLWNQVGWIGRYSNKLSSAILEKAFQLPHPPKNGSSYGLVQLPEGYAVIALHELREGVVKDQKQSALFAEQIQNSEGLLEYELYKQSIIQKSKVKLEGSI